MLLAVDAGNTNTVFAVFDDSGAVRGEWRASTRGSRTADEYTVWLGRLMEQSEIEPADIHAVIIATVVPSGLFDLRTLSRKYFGCEPLVIGDPGVDLGIEVKVDRPQEVGADRLVNAVAAHDRYGGPLIVVDFGTATTFDVIDRDGAYLGGVISPGINLSVEALHQAAAQLPRIAVEPSERIVGKNTVDAMRTGVFWGYVGLIEGIVGRIEAEQGTGKLRVIATGGLAPLFAHHAAVIERADPDLTLHGLLLIHRRNVT